MFKKLSQKPLSYHKVIQGIFKVQNILHCFCINKKGWLESTPKRQKKILGLQLKITSKLQDKIYVLFLPLSSLAGRFCRPVFRARVSVRARARELKKESVAQPPVYTIVGLGQTITSGGFPTSMLIVF